MMSLIDLNDKYYLHHPFITSLPKRNRKLLINLFEEEDFVVDLKEYWYFDDANAGRVIGKGEAIPYMVLLLHEQRLENIHTFNTKKKQRFIQ